MWRTDEIPAQGRHNKTFSHLKIRMSSRPPSRDLPGHHAIGDEIPAPGRHDGDFLVLLLLILSLTLFPTPTFADYQTGLDAYTSGNYNKALLEWKAATTLESTGNTHAETQYAIGMLYWLGQGVTKDYFKASEWMHKAGDQGHAGAQAKLGFLYSQGIAVKEDKNQAFNWFSKAAKQGDVDGQYNLGIFYLNGWGTKQNQAMAAQYLAAAAAQGDESAEYELQKLVDQIAQSKTQTTPKIKSEIPDRVRHDNNLSEGGTGQTSPSRQAQATLGRHPGLDPGSSLFTSEETPKTKSEIPDQVQPPLGRHPGLDPGSSLLTPKETPKTKSEIPAQVRTSSGLQAQTSLGRHPGLDPGSSLLTPEETPKTKSEIPDQVRHDNNLSEGGKTQATPSRQAQSTLGRHPGLDPGSSLLTSEETPKIKSEIPDQVQPPLGRHPGLDPGSSLLTAEETPKTKSETPDDVQEARRSREHMDVHSDQVRHDNNLTKEAPNQVRHDESSIFLTSTWIQQQNPNNYTIQVIGLSSKADLEKLLRGHNNLAPMASFSLQRSGKSLHMLIQGNYPDVGSARYARDNFPTSVQKRKQLWIRQFTKIQQLIRAETGGQSE